MDITFKNVSYTYQPNTPFEHQALNDVSFHIPSEKFVAIIGHTGSGKSTLIQHLNGLMRPTQGEVKIGPYRLTNTSKIENIKNLRRQVGIVFQYPEHQLFEETVEKDVAFGPINFGLPKEELQNYILYAMEKVGLTKEFLDRSPFELSGGQMRRVAIAGVLATQPNVLVLDEPTAGLDPRGQQEMMDMFYRLHKHQLLTTVLVTHHMEHALMYADHVIILNQGSVYSEGSPEEVFSNRSLLQEVQLDVPEIISFLQQFEKLFGHTINYERQSVQEIAQLIAEFVIGDEQQ